MRSLAELKYFLDIDPAIRTRDSFGARMFDELGGARSEEFFQKLIRDADTSWDSGATVDIVSREMYKDFGATGPDWRPSKWIFSQFEELPEGATDIRN